MSKNTWILALGLIATTATSHAQLFFHSDIADDAVYKVSISGTVTTFATGIDGAYGMALGSNGTLYVVGYTAGIVAAVTPGGSVSTFASGLGNPRAIVIDGSGNLFVGSDNSNIYKITSGGSVSVFADSGDGIINPHGLAFALNGDLYVANNGSPNALLKFTPGGSGSTVISGFWTDASSLTINSSDLLYFSRYNGGVIYESSLAGSWTSHATGIGQIREMTIDPNGDLFVTEVFGNTIQQVNSSGVKSTFVSGLTSPTGILYSSIPEPSTYAAIAGLAALGLALWRRRKLAK